MKALSRDDLLEVVGCEIALRPDAPGIEELAARVLGSQRSGDVLRVKFASDAKEDVEGFASAERTCCGGIDWDVSGGEGVILTIRGSRQAVDVIEGVLNGELHIEKRQ